jgi:hypothetical protein
MTLVLSVLLSTGCYYNKEDELYGLGCDTTHVTYSVTVTGIIANYNCLSCHGGTAPSAGFSLEGHANVKAKVTDGRLFGAINHSPGYIAMPENAPKMSQCDINKMKAWIDAGAPDN